MDGRLHLVPRVQLEGVVGDGGAHLLGRVTVHSVGVTELGLVIVTIWLSKALNMLEGSTESVLELLHNREIWAGIKIGSSCNSGWNERVGKGINSVFLQSCLLRPLKCLLEEHICIV